MKAIRKSDGKEIEVTLLKPRQYVSAERRDGVLQTVYYEDGLILEEPVDWNAFRREAAKDILVGLCANNNISYYGNSTTALASSAIALADELIKQLKES